MITRITTFSGSTYDIRKDENGQWWLRGKNVVNWHSVPMDDEWWEIDEPFPMPVLVGHRLILASKYVGEPLDNPKRIKGGGKITSEVIEVQEIPD